MTEVLSYKKLLNILACPNCLGDLENLYSIKCTQCGLIYSKIDSIPAPVINPLIKEYLSEENKIKSFKEYIKSLIPIPDERLWSFKARHTISDIFKEFPPNDSQNYVVNMGSGTESIYKKIFKPFNGLIRIGIPHDGRVDAYGDAMLLPLKSNSVDLFISSSVIEHLPDPEKAVSELFRTIKPGGLVYAEIPFIAAFHMAPHDYQRYTISGIESLFNRHGFVMENKGVCSGPINAFILLLQHSIIEIIPWGPPQYILRLILTWLLHPFKYLDFLFGQSRWSKYLACNFFYLGRKPC